MGRLIGISPIVGYTIPEKKYEYPFEELRDIVKSFEGRFFNLDNSNLELEFKSKLDYFREKVLHEQNVIDNERYLFQFNYSLGENSFIQCVNLFTACIIYGKYVPAMFLVGRNEFEYKNGDRIVFDELLAEYVFIPKGNIVNLQEIFPINSDSNVSVHKLTLVEKIDILNDINLEDCSIDRLYELLNKANRKEYHLIYDEITRKKEIKLQKFRIENPGVPDNAIEIVSNKTYSGRSDANFEVKTINGKIWFIPIGSCCEFYETNIDGERK